jgi:hypothetical protein
MHDTQSSHRTLAAPHRYTFTATIRNTVSGSERTVGHAIYCRSTDHALETATRYARGSCYANDVVKVGSVAVS